MPYVLDDMAVALGTNAFGMERWKSPILTLGEERIRRRPGGDAGGKGLALTPDVVAIRVHAERQIEIKPRSAGAGLGCQGLQLFVGEPLNVEMITPDVFVIIS